MDSFRSRDLRGSYDSWDVEVAIGCQCTTNANILIRKSDVQRLAVSFRVDGHRLNAELVASSHDSKGDLPAVGDENLPEQMSPRSGRIDSEQNLPELHRLRILNADLGDPPTDFTL